MPARIREDFVQEYARLPPSLLLVQACAWRAAASRQGQLHTEALPTSRGATRDLSPLILLPPAGEQYRSGGPQERSGARTSCAPRDGPAPFPPCRVDRCSPSRSPLSLPLV